MKATVLTLAAVGQIVLAILLYDEGRNSDIINLGWLILWIAGVFGCLPIITFKKYGKVPQGKGYMETTMLVDRGVYAIVRHPQYLAGILIGLALPLITNHWSVVILGIVVMVINYTDMFTEESACIEKFGEVYCQYMERVPRVNFVLGVIRLIMRKVKANGKPSN